MGTIRSVANSNMLIIIYENSLLKKSSINKLILSGNLAYESNLVDRVVLKYSEPIEGWKPFLYWILYTLKNEDVLGDPFPIYKSSYYLIGRDRKVVDIPIDHLSCSGQHAVLQYRLITSESNVNNVNKIVSPYIMDLYSVHGTFLNGKRLEPARYYELYEKDVVRFGNSLRDYVLLLSESALS